MSLRQFAPPAFVAALLFSLFLSIFPATRFLPLLVPLLYLLVDISASAMTAAKKGWHFFPLLLFVFAILHISYGLGFLVGLIKFWNRWNDKIGKVPFLSKESPR